MNRLWIRLSFIFTLVIFVGGMIFFLSTSIFIANGIPNQVIVDSLQAHDGLVDQLEDYFQIHGSWEGVETLLQAQDMAIPRAFTRPGIVMTFAGSEGEIIYSGFGMEPDAVVLLPREVEQALPIVVDEITQGYLSLKERSGPISDEQPPLAFPVRNWTNGLLAVFVVGGLLSVLAGVIASRQLTIPLNKLAETARSFGSKNLSVRAAVRGTSEIREVAAAFNDMAIEVEQAERLRRNMIADVAHELRTPLTVLQANLQAMLDDVYPLNKEEISALANQVDLLRRLVNDLHVLAQAESNQLLLTIQPVELNSLVNQTLDKFEAVAREHQIALKSELPTHQIIVSADQDRLTQVLNNLLQNALTHTPDGGMVTVMVSEVEENALLRVQDTGMGIPKEAQAHVFDRFYRVDSSRDRASGGAGLGLAIVKAIVELHRGSISVSSAGVSDLGTAFTIQLPLKTT